MELWIRSQDKGQLVKGSRFRITPIDDNTSKDAKYGIQFCIDYKNAMVMTLIGIYNKKERALEVLDDIEERIHDLGTQSTFNNVYMMPEE